MLDFHHLQDNDQLSQQFHTVQTTSCRQAQSIDLALCRAGGGQLLVYTIIGRKSVLMNHFMAALLRQLQTAQKDSKAKAFRAIDTVNLLFPHIFVCDHAHSSRDPLFRLRKFYFQK
jgi:hypothetical protein